MRAPMLIAALAAVAGAYSNAAAPLDRREAIDIQAIQLDISTKCSSEVLDLVQSIPTPPIAILTEILGGAASDLCSFSTDGSLSAVYYSYSKEVFSWLSSNSDDLSSIYKDCPDVSSYASVLSGCNTVFTALVQGPNSNVASTTVANGASSTSTANAAGATATSTPTSTGDSSASTAGSDEVPTTSSNAAARETGFVVAALAVAGLAAAAL